MESIVFFFRRKKKLRVRDLIYIIRGFIDFKLFFVVGRGSY